MKKELKFEPDNLEFDNTNPLPNPPDRLEFDDSALPPPDRLEDDDF